MVLKILVAVAVFSFFFIQSAFGQESYCEQWKRNGFGEPKIVANPPRGLFLTETSVKVTLSLDPPYIPPATNADDPKPQIHYVIQPDASSNADPGLNVGSVFEAGDEIELTKTSVVAMTASCGETNSTQLVTHTYVLIEDVLANHEWDTRVSGDPDLFEDVRKGLSLLPIASLWTPDGVVEPTQRRASLEFIYPRHPDALFPAPPTDYQVLCGIKNYGAGSLSFPKKNFRLYFKSEFGAKKMKFPVFFGQRFAHLNPVQPTEEFDRLQLHAGGHDTFFWSGSRTSKSSHWMHNTVGDELMHAAGNLGPHGRYVHAYVNGKYYGQYYLRERLDNDFFESYLGKRPDNLEYEGINKNVAYSGTGTIWTKIMNNNNNFNAIENDVNWKSWIDYMLLNQFFVNTDWRFDKNWQSGGGPPHGIMFHLSDNDISIRPGNERSDWTNRDGPGRLWSGLVSEKNPKFLRLVNDRTFQLYERDQGAFTAIQLWLTWNRIAGYINHTLQCDMARWGKDISPRYEMAWWHADHDRVRQKFMIERVPLIITQMENRGLITKHKPATLSTVPISPAMNEMIEPTHLFVVVSAGSRVNLTNTDGSVAAVIYTVDGQDPWDVASALGDGVDLTQVNPLPSGLRRLLPSDQSSMLIPVSASMTVRTRSLDSANQWSAENALTVVLDQGQCEACGFIAVTEIHYSPEYDAGEDTVIGVEFIELKNVHPSRSFDLTGWSLGEGIRSQLPQYTALGPGQYYVITKNAIRFQSIYGRPANHTFFGKLKNSGETVVLKDALDRVVVSVRFDDQYPWPELADGTGHSLVRIDETIVQSSELESKEAGAANWRISKTKGGSPGLPDNDNGIGDLDNAIRMIMESAATIQLNEFMVSDLPGQSFFELTTTHNESVSMSGWIVSDDNADPRGNGFTLALDAVLGPNQFLVLSGPSLPFKLDSREENLHLFPADGDGRLLGTRIELNVVPTPKEVAVGLVSLPDGTKDYVWLSQPTENLANADRQPAEVLVSGFFSLSLLPVSARPSGSLFPYSFVELYYPGAEPSANNSSSVVVLRGKASASSWSVWLSSQTKLFDFGSILSTVELRAGSRLYLIDSADRKEQIRFKQLMNLTDDTQVLGPILSTASLQIDLANSAALASFFMMLKSPVPLAETSYARIADISEFGNFLASSSPSFSMDLNDTAGPSIAYVSRQATSFQWQQRVLCPECVVELVETVGDNGGGPLSPEVSEGTAGLAVGLAIGVILLVALGGAGLVLFKRRQNQSPGSALLLRSNYKRQSRRLSLSSAANVGDTLRPGGGHTRGGSRRTSRQIRRVASRDNNLNRFDTAVATDNIYQPAPHREEMNTMHSLASSAASTDAATVLVRPLHVAGSTTSVSPSPLARATTRAAIPPPIAAEVVVPPRSLPPPPAPTSSVTSPFAPTPNLLPPQQPGSSAFIEANVDGVECPVCGNRYLDQTNLSIHRSKRGH